MRIVATPAFSNEAGNPYTAALYRSVGSYGVVVTEFSTRQTLLGEVQIWHLHWPDLLMNARTNRVKLKRVFWLVSRLVLARLRGVKVVWTVHNLKPHDYQTNFLQSLGYAVFIRAIDGFISMTEYGHRRVREIHPVLRRARGFVIPHVHYTDLYPNMWPSWRHDSTSDSRRKLMSTCSSE